MEIKPELIQQINGIIAGAKERAVRSVDTERVLMYWQIGKVILEEEQEGKERAGYGKYLIKSISGIFQPQFGTGFSVRQLERNRQFYRLFPIASALRTQFSWTHYRILIRLDSCLRSIALASNTHEKEDVGEKKDAPCKVLWRHSPQLRPEPILSFRVRAPGSFTHSLIRHPRPPLILSFYHSIIPSFSTTLHSDLRLFTGFRNAALML